MRDDVNEQSWTQDEPYVPDIGETFIVSHTWTWRQWQWTPFPWYRRRTHTETSSYRVNSWMRRRSPLPVSHGEDDARIALMFAEMIADGRIDPPRGFGPDNVPMEFCHREEAEYVSGVGVGGVIARLDEITLTGRVPWSEELIRQERDHANQLAGEPLT
jgi:hypothetical protein